MVAAAVASVWPRLGTTPCSASTREQVVEARGLRGEGHRGRPRRAPRRAPAQRPRGSPGRIAAGSCAPHRVAARNGPSRCRPASRPVGDQRGQRGDPPGELRGRRGDQAGELGRGAVGAVVGHRLPGTRRVGLRETVAGPAVAVDVHEPGQAATGRTEAAVSPPRPVGRRADPADAVTGDRDDPVVDPAATGDHRAAQDQVRHGVHSSFGYRRSGGLGRLDGLGGLGVVLQLAAGGPQVPAPDDEPEQDVVDDGVAQPDRDEPQRPGGDVRS